MEELKFKSRYDIKALYWAPVELMNKINSSYMFLLFAWEGERGTEKLSNCIRKSINIAVKAKITYHYALLPQKY